MRNELETPVQATKNVEELLVEAIKSGKWMVAIWKASEDEVSLLGRTCWKFPVSSLLPAIDLLKKDFESEELKGLQSPGFGSPLPKAMEMALQEADNPCETSRSRVYKPISAVGGVQEKEPVCEEPAVEDAFRKVIEEEPE